MSAILPLEKILPHIMVQFITGKLRLWNSFNNLVIDKMRLGSPLVFLYP